MKSEGQAFSHNIEKTTKAIILLIGIILLSLIAFYAVTYIPPLGNKEKNILKICFIIGILALTLLIHLFYKMYRQILSPLKELYQGIAQVETIASLDPQVIEIQGDYLTPITSGINEVFLKLKYLINLIENLNRNESFPEVVNYIYSSFSDFIPYHYIGIALIEEEGKYVKAYHGVSDNHTIRGLPENLFGLKVEIEDTTLGKIIKTGQARIINDLENYVKERPNSSYNEILLKAGIKASITLPLMINERPIGFIFFSSHGKNVYTQDHIKFLKTLANSIALSLEKNKIMNDLVYSSILALAKLAESRDNETGDHLHRMKNYSRFVAEQLFKSGEYLGQIDLDFIENIERFSPLHDIGKVGIKDDVLLKSGKLTEEEFELMKMHTLLGTQVLQTAESNINKNGKSIFAMGIEIAENHHEKWDGSGYPHGRKGKEIPLSARIVAIGDVFDALTSKRPYKKAFSFEQAMKILIEGKGRHFDPKIIEKLEKSQEELYQLYQEIRDK